MVRSRSKVTTLARTASLLVLAVVPVFGQNSQRANRRTDATTSASSPIASDPTAPAVTRTVAGRVVNALTGAPIQRALVNLNSRAVLTDAQGKFAFPGFTEANGYAQVSKPGYSSTATPEATRQQKIPDLDAALELKLYPDAILTGVVTGPDGLPLSHIQVRLRRLTFDSAGPRWLASGFAQTDIRGEYRFDTPGGRYAVSTGYTPRSAERGEAVLPVGFPAGYSDEAFEIANAEQRQIDLRPRVGPSYPVALTVDGVDSDRGLRLTAATSSGLSFPIQAQRSDDSFNTRLPAGTFLLRAVVGDRDAPTEGEVRVTVTPRTPSQVALHLAPQPIFPLELAFETAPANTAQAVQQTTPTPQQFNLSLRALTRNSEGFNNDTRLTIRPDRSASFQVAPGHYRLTGNLSGAWYVRSVTSGVTDLMTQELVVAPGSAGSTIRVIASNGVGRLKGVVTTAGLPASGWVYLLPQQPSLTPYFEIYVQTDGTYQWSGAPGNYVAVPSGQQIREDFRNTTFLRKFGAGGREVVVTDGAEASLDLSLAPAGVPR